MAENHKPLTEVEEYKQGLIDKLNAYYDTLVKRLQAEPNIILRYEIKSSLDMLTEVYKLLFKED